MKTNLRLTLPLLTWAVIGTLCACSDKEEPFTNEKENEIEEVERTNEVISFTSDGGAPVTRATALHATADTRIVMRIKSEDSQTTTGHTPGADRYTRTLAVASSTCSSTHNGMNLGAHSDVTFTGSDIRYWDDAYGRYGKLSVYAVAVPGYSDDTVLAPGILTAGSTVWFNETTENEKFTWTLPVTEQTADDMKKKDICYSNNIRKDNTTNPIKDADAGVYRQQFTTTSGTSSWSWMSALQKGQMQWTPQTTGATMGKFDQGHLVFYHALSKLTINLTEATNTSSDNKGFNNSSNTDFKFKSGTNVKLINFPYENQFDLATGKWADYNSSTNKIGDIAKLNETTTSFANITTHTMEGMVIPGKNLWTDTGNSISFTIDDNEYYVTSKQIADAIRAYYSAGGVGANDANASTLKNFTFMEQGKHYQINITVSKSKVEALTAQLVDWETVNANIADPNNAYVHIAVEERNDSQYKEWVTNPYTFDFYRSAATTSLDITSANTFADYTWKTGYVAGTSSAATDKATKTYANSLWSTNWVWPDNKTFYHFRMVGNTEGTSTTPSAVTVKKDATNGDYYEITSGKPSATGSSYKDYTWGAPFVKNSGAKWNYGPTTKGFDGKDDATTHQIYKAIGATNDTINLMMFHTTSQVTVKVTTTTDNTKVALKSGSTETKVELLNFYKDGTVRVGNGLVKPTTTALAADDEFKFISHTAEVAASGTNPATAAYSTFQYGVVPQVLSGNHGTSPATPYTVGLRITTPDGNQYVVKDISTVVVASTAIGVTNLNNPYTAIAAGQPNAGNYRINQWYPGFKYTYTVKIKKTGIVNITAQLVDWETVIGDLGEITLEGC